jgi:membrane protease YdiL (CAAX protease family)
MIFPSAKVEGRQNKNLTRKRKAVKRDLSGIKPAKYPGMPPGELAKPAPPGYLAAMGEASVLKRKLAWVAAYAFGVVFLGAILAPLLFWGGKHVVAEAWLAEGWAKGLHGSMERAHFSRYFNRAILLAAVLLIGPVLRGLRSGGEGERLSWRDRLALAPNPVWWRHGLLGFVVAGGSLLLLGVWYVSRDWYAMKEGAEPWLEVVLAALGTGLAVGLLEEVVFRGAFTALFGRLWRPMTVLVVVAVIFALLHFLQAPRSLKIDPVLWWSGFDLIGEVFAHFFRQLSDPAFFIAEFLVLLAIGLVLGYARWKTGSLWLGIGLHAGWVMGVKILSGLTVRNFNRDAMMPWLGDSLRVGAVSLFVVLLTGAGLWIWLRRRPDRPIT